MFGKKFKKLQLLCLVQKLELADKFGSDAASVGFAFLRQQTQRRFLGIFQRRALGELFEHDLSDFQYI
ncbi:MAG: hypothetical protein WCJ99_19235 [Betaproteobacteria bacterium]